MILKREILEIFCSNIIQLNLYEEQKICVYKFKNRIYLDLLLKNIKLSIIEYNSYIEILTSKDILYIEDEILNSYVKIKYIDDDFKLDADSMYIFKKKFIIRCRNTINNIIVNQDVEDDEDVEGIENTESIIVKSFTDPSKNYFVSVSNGTISCNCMAFKMNQNKICKHMSYLLDQFNEHDDLKSYYHNIYIGITCFNSNHN